MKPRNDPNIRVEYYDWSAWLPTLTTAGFVLAVSLALARATSPDFLREVFEITPGADPAPRVGTPSSTLWLDLACWLPAILALARRAFDRSYVLRFTPAHTLILGLAAMAFASTLWAADAFAAAVNGFHFLSAAVLCWAASQLVRSWMRLRFVAAALAGLLGIYALHGVYYRTVDLPELRRTVEKDKDRILAERGWQETDFAAQQFFRKIQSGEMIAFASSPNTYAAMIVMLGLATATLAIQRYRTHDEFGWPLALAAIVPVAAVMLYFTHSKTAYVTPILGALLIFAGWKFGGRLAARQTLSFALAGALAVVACAAVVGHGAYHKSLVIDSLTFRWKYWLGSLPVFLEHKFLGVGWSNFGFYYLAHRLPEASEEIKDPHNLFVRAFCELGIIGGLLAIGWIARLFWEITRPIAPPPPAGNAPRAGIRLIAIVAGLAMLIAALVSIDFGRDINYVVIELLKRGLYFGLLLLVIAAGTIRSTTEVWLDDRPAPLLLVGCIVAAGMFLLHNLIDFSLWESGPMFVFMLLAGALIGVRGESLAGKKKWNRGAIAAATVVPTLWLVALVGFVAPLADAESRAKSGDEAIRTRDFRRAIGEYRAAVATSPVPNDDYAYRVARAMIYAQSKPEEIEVWLSKAIATNPMNPQHRLMRASFYLNRTDAADYRPQAKADFQAFIELDPWNVQGRLRFAETLEQWGETSAAKAQYEAALSANDKLDPADPKRLPAAQIDAIRRKISGQ